MMIMQSCKYDVADGSCDLLVVLYDKFLASVASSCIAVGTCTVAKLIQVLIVPIIVYEECLSVVPAA